MWYRIAADLVLVVHLLFIGFVVGGSFLAWRWPRFVRVHLPAMVYGALVEFIGFPCRSLRCRISCSAAAGRRDTAAGSSRTT